MLRASKAQVTTWATAGDETGPCERSCGLGGFGQRTGQDIVRRRRVLAGTRYNLPTRDVPLARSVTERSAYLSVTDAGPPSFLKEFPMRKTQKGVRKDLGDFHGV